MPIVTNEKDGKIKTPISKTCTSFSNAYFDLIFRRFLICTATLYFFAFALTFISQLSSLKIFPWQNFVYSFYLTLAMVIIMFTRIVSATFQREVRLRLLDDILAIFTKLDHIILIITYCFSSFILVQYYFVLFQQHSSYKEMFIYPPRQRYGVPQINPDRLFIIFYGLLLGLTYTVKRIMNQRWVIELEAAQDHPFFLIKVYMRNILRTSMRWASTVFGISYLLYIICNRALYYFFVQIFSTYTKVLDAPIIGFKWWDMVLFFKMIIIGWMICSTWEFTDRLVDACFSRIDHFTLDYSNTFECLLNGIRFKKDGRIQGFAIAQLVQISSKNTNKRKTLFDTIQNSYSNSTWFHLKNELISIIEDFRNNIKKEYPVNKNQDKKCITTKTEEQTNKHADKIIKLKESDVYKRKKLQPKELDDRTSLLLKDISIKTTDALPSSDIQLDKIKQQLSDYTINSKNGIILKNSQIKGPIGDWLEILLQKTLNRRIEKIFNKQNIVIWSIQALGNFLVSSMKEDSYGHIQRDISPIVNVMLGCLMDVENYINQPPKDYKNLATPKNDVFLSGPHFVNLALKNALNEIKFTFKDHIQAIKVDDKYVEKWNHIL